MADLSSLAGAGTPPNTNTTPSTTPDNPLSGVMRPDQQSSPQAMVAQMMRPAPSHDQTVATLTQMEEVRKHLEKIAKSPDFGKKNIRPDFYDAAAKLVGGGFVSIPMVMNELKTLPGDPADQKKWIEAKLANISRAEMMILHDHAQAHGTGSLDFAGEYAKAQQPAPGEAAPPMSEMISGVADHYKGKRR